MTSYWSGRKFWHILQRHHTFTEGRNNDCCFYSLRSMIKTRWEILDIKSECKKGELGSVILVGRIWGAVYLSGIHGTPKDPLYTDIYYRYLVTLLFALFYADSNLRCGLPSLTYLTATNTLTGHLLTFDRYDFLSYAICRPGYPSLQLRLAAVDTYPCLFLTATDTTDAPTPRLTCRGRPLTIDKRLILVPASSRPPTPTSQPRDYRSPPRLPVISGRKTIQ